MVLKRLALLALLLASVTGGAARAEEGSASGSENALSNRIDQLEAEIAALRRQPAGAIGGEPGCGCAPQLGCAMDCGCAAPCCECDCCCDCGCDCGCIPGCSCGFYGGAEVFWAQPRWRAFDAITVTTAVGGVNVSNTQGFDYDFDPTARFFAGYTGCNGLGVRASWWQYDNNANDVRFTIPNAGLFAVTGPLGVVVNTNTRTFAATQSLELQTIDFEATSCFEACGGNIIAGFGVRYAKYNVATRETELTAAGTLIEAADLVERFEGWGPTVSVEFVRPLCFTGFSLYSNLRGSVLIGEEHQTFRQFNGAVLTDIASRDAAEGLGIAELQIALQWCHCGWFARGGWQAQYWDDVARDDPPPTGILPVPASNNRSDLIVHGFFFTLGAQY